ncbi:MAG TPA: hypothetical protein VFW09_20875 [Solirubrobacteraceae bacterium]|nr:hypothetical protein [Solirubrobacteraceae bacterium]
MPHAPLTASGSPLRNRATPLGGIVADPARGLVYANRGCLHDDRGELRRRYNGKRWIACRLEFRGRRRAGLMMPGRYTELFFLDEATAFAAGHRPCAECRREDYNAFVSRWSALHRGASGADAIDAVLHDERVDPATHGRRRHTPVVAETLPDAAFVVDDDGEPWLVLGDELLHWTPAGYDRRRPRPGAGALVEPVTPPSLLALLRDGWEGAVPLLHPSAAAR